MLIIHNVFDGKTNPVVNVVVGLQDVSVFNTIVSHQSPSSETYCSFHGYWLTMVLNTETSWSPTTTFYHRICLTINNIVYYQHLLVSFEELLSLRLSDHFALVVGCINNNWCNIWHHIMHEHLSVRQHLKFQILSARHCLLRHGIHDHMYCVQTKRTPM